MHEYWMEDSGGRYGVDLTGFGPYQMPGKVHQYAHGRFQGGTACPAGDTCNKNIRTDGRAAWRRRRSARRSPTSTTSSSTSAPARTSRPPGRSSGR